MGVANESVLCICELLAIFVDAPLLLLLICDRIGPIKDKLRTKQEGRRELNGCRYNNSVFTGSLFYVYRY